MEDSDGGKFPLESPDNTPRRTIRNRTKPKKYDEFLDMSPAKRKIMNRIESSDEDLNEESTPKPNALFVQGDVDGQDIFKFKTRHTKSDLQNKVNSVSSNYTQTPKKPPRLNTSVANRVTEETSKCVANMIKNRAARAAQSDSSDSAWSASDGAASDPEEEEEGEARRSDGGRSPQDYYVAPEQYFLMNSTRKITTSDRTLARLKNLSVDETAAERGHESAEHRQKMRDLVQTYDGMFDRWLYLLSENFNIMLYGVGSKREVLQRFQAEKLQHAPCVVVNGFFPGLTMKSVLETIVMDLLENAHVPTNLGDVASLIGGQLAARGAELFLLVHNADGAALRSARAQAALGALAQLRRVRLLATVDHINAPLLWDHTKLSNLRLTWWDATSFRPYTEETASEGGALASRGAAPQLAALRSVARSLTDNARGIFRLIAEHQLEHHKRPHYKGLPFKELYGQARERFLASSAGALRAQLAEFVDHRLVRDGADGLLVPLRAELLRQFLEQH